MVEKIAPAEPGVAYPRCTGGRREAPPEDCGGIWAFNEYQAELDDTFDASEVTARLAGLAEVLIPAGTGSGRIGPACCPSAWSEDQLTLRGHARGGLTGGG